MSLPEAWLRGPMAGVDPYLMPAAHALVQAAEDLEAVASLSAEELQLRPGGAAPVAFHLRHLAGATGRLLSYARGRPLTAEQLELAASEAEAATPAEPVVLIAAARAALVEALDEIHATPHHELLEPRLVGRQGLPSTVLGVLFHIAEHASRHVGQMVTTARVVRGKD